MADIFDIDTYKQAKGISGTKDDDRLECIIESVNQLVKTYCGNTFVDYVTNGITEYKTVDFSQEQLIHLEEWPLISITSVEERLSETESYTALVEGTDFVADRRIDALKRLDGYWPVGIESVKVEYTAGYTSVPADLLMACVDLTQYFFKEEHKKMFQLAGASMQNMGTSSLEGNVGFPDHIKRILDLYKQI